MEHANTLSEQLGKQRVLAFGNRKNMGSFRDALADAPNNGGIPDVSRVRVERSKRGFGLSAEQNITADITVFGRASWNDGASEAYAFKEIERSVSAGAVVKGTAWNRTDDRVGVAFVCNELSKAHRDYLVASAHGVFTGDGQLNSRLESVVEAYYSVNVANKTWITLDYQRIANPAYNADRGPVSVGSIRLHTQYQPGAACSNSSIRDGLTARC